MGRDKRKNGNDIKNPSSESCRWIMYKQESKRFPYLLCIEEESDKFLFLSVQDRWPGPGKKIYCLSGGYGSSKQLPESVPVEEIEIVKISRIGKKLNIILNRKTKKRCWFLFLKKEYKRKPGEFYEQIFWITQSSATGRRRGAYIPKIKDEYPCVILIDKREKYPYKFGYLKPERQNLPVGDYALVKDEKIIAVAERKTIDNILHEISTYEVLKSKMQELSIYPFKAVVFESPYSDFLNPKKVKPYSAGYIAKIISDLMVNFPDIQFVFCDNRKFAQEWVYRWFLRINALYENDKDKKA